jgi:hypothetical protein
MMTCFVFAFVYLDAILATDTLARRFIPLNLYISNNIKVTV